jgi:hypothetical protein
MSGRGDLAAGKECHVGDTASAWKRALRPW